MVVVPDELIDEGGPSAAALGLVHGETLVIDGFDKAFDLAVRLGRVGPQ